MPTNRKRITRSRGGRFSEVAYQYFAKGPFFSAEGFEKGKNESEKKSLWCLHKATIMSRYLEENHRRGFRGVRPWAWWKWEMLEPQQKIAPGAFESEKAWDYQRSVYDWVETDVQLLKRLSLLELWELS